MRNITAALLATGLLISTAAQAADGALPAGKPAGVRCSQLDDDNGCRIFGSPERPAVCASLQPAADMCGASRGHALAWLARLERETA